MPSWTAPILFFTASEAHEDVGSSLSGSSVGADREVVSGTVAGTCIEAILSEFPEQTPQEF